MKDNFTKLPVSLTGCYSGSRMDGGRRWAVISLADPPL